MIRRFFQRRREESQNDDAVLVTDRAGNTRALKVKTPGEDEISACLPPAMLEEAERLQREMDQQAIDMYEFHRGTHINQESDR